MGRGTGLLAHEHEQDAAGAPMPGAGSAPEQSEQVARTVASKTLTAWERVQRDPMANTEGFSCYEDWKRAAPEQLDQIRALRAGTPKEAGT